MALKAVDTIEARYLHLHYKHYSCCPKHSRELSGDIKLAAAQQKKVRSSASELSHETCLSVVLVPKGSALLTSCDLSRASKKG